MPKPISLWITTEIPDADDQATVLRFKRYAVGHKNYLKALQSLLDRAKVS